MEASYEDIQAYAVKQGMKQAQASQLIQELMRLGDLKEDVDSPVMKYLKQHLEMEMIKHAKAALQDIRPRDNYSYECKCGEKIDLHKIYYQTIGRVWLMMGEIVVNWHKKNEGIIKGSRR